MNRAELSYELGRVVLVRDFIGPSGLVRVVFGPSCPAPPPHTNPPSKFLRFIVNENHNGINLICIFKGNYKR